MLVWEQEAEQVRAEIERFIERDWTKRGQTHITNRKQNKQRLEVTRQNVQNTERGETARWRNWTVGGE